LRDVHLTGFFGPRIGGLRGFPNPRAPFGSVPGRVRPKNSPAEYRRGTRLCVYAADARVLYARARV